MQTIYPGRATGTQVRSTCPNCGGKGTLVWSTEKPHPYKCHKCARSGNVFTEGYKEKNYKKESAGSDMTELERLVIGYRKRSGKRHRLSDRVIAEFSLHVKNQISKKTGRMYPALCLPNQNGETMKRLVVNKWIAMDKALQPDGIWLNEHNLKKNPANSAVIVTAGEWDMFSLYENAGIHSISPVFGESPRTKWPVKYLELFAGQIVYILYDNDTAGRAGAESLASAILRHVKVKTKDETPQIKVINMSNLGLKAGEDLDDFFSKGGTKERLKDEIRSAQVFTDDTPAYDHETLASLPEREIACPVVEHSILEKKTLDMIWRIGARQKNTRDALWDILARQEGYDPGDSQRSYNHRLRQYENELETLNFLAYDDLVKEAVKKLHLKAEKRTSIADEHRNYYFYESGVYRPFREDIKKHEAEHIARQLNPADSRFRLSRVRNQVIEDINLHLIQLPDSVFNSQSHILNFQNCLYNLKTGQSAEHTPDHLSTFQLGIEYKPDAKAENLHTALETWFASEDTRREFIKMLYYIITGDRSKQLAFFLIGKGGDGKGEAAKLMQSLIGEERTSSISLEDLDRPYMTSNLYGMWLNIADEIGRKTHINDSQFKRVTGGSLITADIKYGQPVKFIPMAQWVVLTNSLFSSSDNSYGFNRRLKFLQFQSVPKDKIVADFFKSQLEPELSGVANYLLNEGRAMYQSEGFLETEDDRSLRDELQRKHTVNAFWSDKIEEILQAMKESGQSRDLSNDFKSDIIKQVPDDIQGKSRFAGSFYVNPTEQYQAYRDFSTEQGQSAVNLENFVNDSRNQIERIMNDKEINPAASFFRFSLLKERIKIKEMFSSQAQRPRVLIFTVVNLKNIPAFNKEIDKKVQPTSGYDLPSALKIWAGDDVSV